MQLGFGSAGAGTAVEIATLCALIVCALRIEAKTKTRIARKAFRIANPLIKPNDEFTLLNL